MSALRAELIAIFLVLGGCVCNDGVCGPSGGTPESKIFATAGGSVTAKVVLARSCGVRVPTSTNVSVLDPAGDAIQSSAGDPRNVPGSGFEVDVTFTPAIAGTYHVTARFEPNFGVAQLDVLVAAEMRDAGSLTVSRPCARGDFSPGGLVLCTNGGTLDVLMGSTPVQSFVGLTARAGRTLWVSDGGTVERWQEDAGAYELVATARAPAPHQSISPTEDDAVFVTSTGGGLQLWLDGGIVSVPAPSLPNNAVWRKGGQIVTVSSAATLNSCIAPVPGFTDAGLRCSTLSTPTVLGYGPEGIWVANVTMTPSDEVLLVDETGSGGFGLPTGWRASGLGRITWDTGALIDSDAGASAGVFVVRLAGADLLLENYGTRPRAITSSCVTLPSATQPAGTDTRLIRR